MSLTVAQISGLSGLNANGRNIQTVGNNIANSNTTGFKSTRLMFANQVSQNLSIGGGPSDTFGGANPTQIGLGVSVAGTQRNFNGGSLSTTGDFRDMAIEGDGMFIVERGGGRFYTRAGGFRQNSLNELTSVTGERLMGYGVDGQYQISTGTLQPVTIPMGQLRLAEASTEVRFTGNLNSGGLAATRGARLALPALVDTTGPFGANLTQATSLLTNLDDPNIVGNQSLFATGQQIQISGARKGGKTLPDAAFTVTATSTVQDLMDFVRDALGLNPAAGVDPAGFTPGVTLDPLTGIVQIVGNTGSANDLDVQQTNIRLLTSTGTLISTPLNPTKAASADGESIRNSFVVYDSLGNPITVDLTMVLEARDNTGTRWRYFAESADDTDVALQVGTGTINFDPQGRLVPPTATPSIVIDRNNTGAQTPLAIALNLSSASGNVTALAAPSSSLAATYQDGTPLGTLNSFAVGPDGIITGGFSNGLTRTIGQVVLAKFTNPEGLNDVGNNLYAVGPNSGEPIIATAQTLGTGRVVGGALELSNVDLAQEFITLIQASTGYSANSRVITTADQLLQQLLAIGR
jgi:flagellar hook protein FlgE